VLRAFKITFCAGWLLAASAPISAASGWLNWRGHAQVGHSAESDLLDDWVAGGRGELWTVELAGRGTPVVADGVLYAMGYRGRGADLREVLVAVDAETGVLNWERSFRDFLSDIIYDRYAISSPTVDGETGNIYAQTSNGVLFAVSPAGEMLWEVSMMERYGRLSFPNGRTGSPIIEGNRVIVHGITANWGREGPGRDRFYAFDKHTGELNWSSTPGVRPVDSSFSTPYVETRNGMRVLYAGTGCGHVVAINVNNGEPLWRAPVSIGGVNVSVVVHGDTLIAIHAKENRDDNTVGRMVAFDLTATPTAQSDGSSPVLDAELWRASLSSFTSSPVLAEGVIYQVTMTGELVAVDPTSGQIFWKEKIGADQLHASPLYADGKLYIPFREGRLVIVRPSREGLEILSDVAIDGTALGAPVPHRGRVYFHTTEKLYALGTGAPGPMPSPNEGPQASVTEAATLQVLPAEFLIQAGEKQQFRGRTLDANGYRVGEVVVSGLQPWIPPSAKVQSTIDGTIRGDTVHIESTAGFSAGAYAMESGGITGTSRGRSIPAMPFAENFEGFELSHARGEQQYAYPPLAWIGARFKWEVQEEGDSQVLKKTLSKMLFQRSMAFIGHPDSRNYSMQANLRVDGNRRSRSTVGLVHQRYIIALKGNQRQLEVSSNYERLRYGVPFEVEPGQWYTLKTMVMNAPSGETTIRAKAWPKGTPEPESWTLEFVHADGHTRGAPGIFGFSPQNLFSVYVDDLSVVSEEQ
jgi:outer membrane protein assembly factor BamB